MINKEILNKYIIDSGMTIVSISEKSGILRETLYNKLSGQSEFKASEIVSICSVLKIPSFDRDRIFFDEKSELNSTKEDM